MEIQQLERLADKISKDNNIALTAVAKGGQWQQALTLVNLANN